MEGMEEPSDSRYKLTATSISYRRNRGSFQSLLKGCNSSSYILKDISLTALPCEILAIVGPSGSGKSTLLDILSARTLPSHGTLVLNSAPLLPSSFRKLSSYVPQHDHSLPLLTVSETFLFSAKLLRPNSSPSQLSSLVSSLLSQLSLSHLSDTLLARCLSGGERRRVSIGLSLLHDPSVLLLDEPTSGLDSTSAFKVIHILKQLCISRNRTIILSIHQPSFKILSCIDTILLLSNGRVLHHGPLPSLQSFLHSHGFTVPHQLNALEYAMEILTHLSPPPPLPQSPHTCSNSTSSTPTFITSVSDFVTTPHIIIAYRSSRLHEVLTLYTRFWKIIYRTKQLLLTNTAEALLVGLVLGTIYINIGFDKEGIEKRFGLFAFTLTFLLSSTTETLPIFINERPILLRETSSGLYRLSSYLIANTLVFLPYLFVIALIYSVPVYFLVGLCASWLSFAYFVLVIWVIVLTANSFVLFLSSLAPNYIAGTSLLTVLLAAFFLFSGYFISKESLPKYWLFMHFFSMYKYALDALLINEYSCLETRCLIWYKENEQCMVTGGDVLQKRGLKESERWTNVYFLVGFFLLYRLLCFFVLLRRVSRSKT